MPAKPVKTKIKVEELVDKPVVEEEKKEAPIKISSFSQLDTEVTPMVLAKDDTLMPTEPIEDIIEPTVKTEVKVEEKAANADEIIPEKMSSDDVKQWLKDIRPDTTKEVEKSGNGFNLKMFFGFLLIFAALRALIGGLFYYKQKVNVPLTTSTETPTPEAVTTPQPTATPAVNIDLTKLSVNILNGSGIKGEANKVKALLKTAGFTDEKVSTGNASTYDYKTTSVSLKKEVSDEVFEKIKKALGTDFDVVKGVGTVKDSSAYDVEIMVGKKSSNEPG